MEKEIKGGKEREGALVEEIAELKKKASSPAQMPADVQVGVVAVCFCGLFANPVCVLSFVYRISACGDVGMHCQCSPIRRRERSVWRARKLV